MAFEQLEIECNAKKINGYPISTTKTPNTIPVAGLNGNDSNVLSNKLNGSFFNMYLYHLGIPFNANYANYNLKYSGATGNWVQTKSHVLNASSSGYAVLEVGESSSLVLQWGSTGVAYFLGPSATITFPIAFSSTPYIVMCTPKWMDTNWTTADFESQVITSSITSTQAVIRFQFFGVLPFFSFYCDWIALGNVTSL